MQKRWEVKARGGDINEAIAQLGLWCAAGLEKLQRPWNLAKDKSKDIDEGVSKDVPHDVSMEETNARQSKVLQPYIPPLVGWVIIGHEWRLYISWKDEKGDVVSAPAS